MNSELQQTAALVFSAQTIIIGLALVVLKATISSVVEGWMFTVLKFMGIVLLAVSVGLSAFGLLSASAGLFEINLLRPDVLEGRIVESQVTAYLGIWAFVLGLAFSAAAHVEEVFHKFWSQERHS